MDRSRREGAAPSPPPASSRLTVRAKPNRRKRSGTAPGLWARVPKPTFDGCRRALRRALPAIAGLALLGAIGGSALAGYRFVTTSSRFAIEDIQIRGNHHLTIDQVRQTLPVAVGDNVFTTDLDTVVR